MIKFVIIVFTLFCPVAFSVKHSFKMFLTATSGVPDFPEFAASLLVDEVQAVCCDSIVGKTEPKVNWAREFLKDNPQHQDFYVHEYKTQSQFLKDMIDGLMKSSDNIGGAHILQQIHGCEWDDETGEVRGFNQFGYNGEDFIELDMQTRTWKASKPQASIFKQRWDTDKAMLNNSIYYHLTVFPDWLKIYIHFAESFLQRTDLPSVSLLQKTPSSPVSCHATGFYPNRADLFWRKDREKLHDVDKVEILPNHDGTFQMSVDLKISSIAPEDWKKYDCVFQLSGVKDDIITKLDKSVIRTNPMYHSLKYFYTASSQVPNFPEFVVVGMVDDVQIVHYDSNTSTAVHKQNWMDKVTDDDPKYFNRSTRIFMGQQQTFKDNIEELKQRFSQTGGVHIYQVMYGCEWDDKTDEVYSYRQYGYDGEDFISLDLKRETWIAPKQQAVITKHNWDINKDRTAYLKDYHNRICPEWGKKYVNYGRSSLMRKDLLSVSLLQKTPSSPVTCHATGFYPNRAYLFWRKDGVEIHEDVDKGEILPNHDGTFQMSVDLNISSITPEDWKKYECVFWLFGVKDDIITELDKSVIRTNNGNPLTMIIPIVVVAVVVLAVIAVVGFIVYKKNKNKRPPSPAENQEVQEEMLPRA